MSIYFLLIWIEEICKVVKSVRGKEFILWTPLQIIDFCCYKMFDIFIEDNLKVL